MRYVIILAVVALLILILAPGAVALGRRLSEWSKTLFTEEKNIKDDDSNREE